MARKTKAELAEILRRKNKAIKDRNYRFGKMTDQQKRITIAKDVMSLLVAEKLVATTGTYLSIDSDLESEHWDTGWEGSKEGADDVELHTLIEQTASCEVCGIGACFVAAVRRADKCTVGDMNDANDDSFMREYLNQWFDEEQIQLIETAFEMRTWHYMGRDKQLRDRAIAFGAENALLSHNDSARLSAIMQNIVDNGGEFVP